MKKCSVSELREALRSGRCRVIDVREAPEYEAEHIPGTSHAPLSTLDEKRAKDLAKEASGDVIFVCKSGMRAQQAAEKWARWGCGDARVLEGGMGACVREGLPTTKGQSRVWELERQVRFAAGTLVLAGVSLGFTVNPGFFYLAGFVGAGLVFAAVTNTCGMAMILARMPWNRRCSS